MNINKAVLALAFSSIFASGVASAEPVKDQGHGKITFTGSIIDAPCSIAPGDDKQTVELGQVSDLALANGGSSLPAVFKIRLTQCDTTDLKGVTATFSGVASAANADLLGISGTAKGASIAITDATGTLIPLGSASASQELLNGENTLAFAAYLQGNGASATVVPGSFQSVADFTLSYE